MPTLHSRRHRAHPRESSISRARRPAKARSRSPSQDESRIDALLRNLEAVRDGNFAVRVPVQGDDALGRVETVLNDVIARTDMLTRELLRTRERVGRDGNVDERASLAGAGGGWATSIGAVNALVADLARPTNEVERVISAVVRGDLSQRMELRVDGHALTGEFLRVSTTVNGLVEQLTEMS
jgi:methyl-accepting chemotaxis protein